ncbi:MAG: serine hydroxymethyltransferase [Candidatus Methanosuratincola verstraetei]|jgi:glycine hydroxymethyltransferase|uniref:Serine hydroxymethyltransferase n=1 Tax=Methanosuratincola subterraneus TaxID=2593994 RepID=A0A444L571_METS7|nr:MAG: Serine hydroxymethyltransferase (tetrahydromethanopterin-dependent) [Candidatus Methanosuratincola subterraneus]
MPDSNREKFERVLKSIEDHHRALTTSLPMIASENVPSPSVREALASDFGNRYAEGWVGERVYAGCKYLDEVESIAIELGKALFHGEFVDVRPISGVFANLATFSAFTNPGDVIFSCSIPTGGHISHAKEKLGGTAGLIRKLDVQNYPFDIDDFNIDLDETEKMVRELDAQGKKPKMFILGASVFLFPHPVKEIVDLAKTYGAKVVYDAAHVAGLIAGGIFQDPLNDGVDAMTMSTHKTLAGPQHGTIVSWEKYAEPLKKAVFPGLSSNHHLHAVAGVAIAFAEAMEFYKEYARAIVMNSKALAQALYERGIDALYEKRGFTESHIVLVDVTKYGNGFEIEKKLEAANIIVNRNLLPYDKKMGRDYRAPGGIRLGTQELTRLGMKKSEMVEIAELMKSVIVDGDDPKEVAQKVSELRAPFQKVQYCFSNQTDAYQHIKIR